MMLMIKVLGNKLTRFNKDEMDEEHFYFRFSVDLFQLSNGFLKFETSDV
jgi:hypothetical protein